MHKTQESTEGYIQQELTLKWHSFSVPWTSDSRLLIAGIKQEYNKTVLNWEHLKLLDV